MTTTDPAQLPGQTTIYDHLTDPAPHPREDASAMSTHGIYLLTLPAPDDPAAEYERSAALSQALDTHQIPGLTLTPGHTTATIDGRRRQLYTLTTDTDHIAATGPSDHSLLDLARCLHQAQTLRGRLRTHPELSEATCHYGAADALPTDPTDTDPTAGLIDLEQTCAELTRRWHQRYAAEQSGHQPPAHTPSIGLFQQTPPTFTPHQQP